MSEQTEPEKTTDPKTVRASERTRAYRLRKRIDSGAGISDDDTAWLANYDATKRGAAKVEPEKIDGKTPDATEPVTPAPEPTPPPPPPPPPRVSAETSPRDDDADDRKNGDWRKKYRGGGRDGRERTVLAIASQWKAGLHFMAEQIKLSGSEPMVDVEALWPYIVITVDDVLPERIQLKPAHVAAGGTTILLVQRIARHKKVGEAYERMANSPPIPQKESAAPEPSPPTPPPTSVIESKPPEATPPPIKIPTDVATEFSPGPTDVY